MDSEFLTRLLKFIEYFPDYLSALSRMLLRFFGQPLSKQKTLKTMRTIEDKNIPSGGGGGQILIQVQLIQSLPFVTTMKKKKNTTTTKKKILDRILNA